LGSLREASGRAERLALHRAIYVNGAFALECADGTVTQGEVGLGAGGGKSGLIEVFRELEDQPLVTDVVDRAAARIRPEEEQ
jgi:hypothetical protein